MKRLIRVRIQIDNIIKEYSNFEDETLKIDFEVDNSIDNSMNNGKLTIVNLTKQDAAFLTTNYNFNTSELKKSFLSLEAGYKNNFSLLLQGYVFNIDSDFDSPDLSVTLDVMPSFSNVKIQDSFKNITFKSLCKKIAENNNLKLDFDKAISDFIIDSYVFTGNSLSQINNLREYAKDAKINVNNGTLHVKSENVNNSFYTLINSQNWLIGTPKITNFGISARTFLNPALSINSAVKLESEKLKQINGFYRIQNLKHIGSNRSENWESQMLLLKA